eukprot:CAMPEP_0174706538 /NCGR_PEP_ID=MMETSP1094-20130205/9348_1 /TAXON_ID=156173 /ORGANISM="Chrysochromulina brevifilum, Strain UTEX LB 985" /LENGTH=45 /DNA_ID= /DNA_START= /DNA_END= /DNA_ORIENTATION=
MRAQSMHNCGEHAGVTLASAFVKCAGAGESWQELPVGPAKKCSTP